MKLNENCMIDIMFTLERELTPTRKVKTSELYALLPDYDQQDIVESVRILLEKSYITRTNPQNKVNPKAAKIQHITASGYDYLQIIHSSELPHKAKRNFKLISDLLLQGLSTSSAIVTIKQALGL